MAQVPHILATRETKQEPGDESEKLKRAKGGAQRPVNEQWNGRLVGLCQMHFKCITSRTLQLQ